MSQEPYLEDRSRDQGFKQTHRGVGQIVETPSPNLEEREEDKWNQERKKCRKPDGYDFFAQWICELRIDDVSVLIIQRERSTGCRRSHVDPETQSTHQRLAKFMIPIQ